MENKKKYDVIVIGMGPAGMAVSAMASVLGLDVLAIEKRKVGGECLNIGCIPSKALLKASNMYHSISKLKDYGIYSEQDLMANTCKALEVVRTKIDSINDKKLMKTFEKVDLVLREGDAEFIDKHTIKVAGKIYTGKKIFVATGTEPFIPPIPGVETLTEEQLITNVNIFDLEKVPETMTIIGGGAIGTEMAQAFSRLETKVNLVQMDAHLIPIGDADAGELLKEMFEKEGIGVYNSTKIEKIEVKDGIIYTHTDNGVFESEKLLIATGRKPVIETLKLDNAGVKYTKRGITVNEQMRTNIKNIYAVGDINAHAMLSHAAMHQGMLALMDAMNPTPFKLKRSNYIVPWSVFTNPEVAQAGMTEKQAKEKNLNVIIMRREYSSYGRTVVDGHPEGFIKVITNKRGKIYGVTIIGESASEMIHEWILAIQNNMSMYKILMMQHSFPTISMISKMVAEDWLMQKMKTPWIGKLAKKLI